MEYKAKLIFDLGSDSREGLISFIDNLCYYEDNGFLTNDVISFIKAKIDIDCVGTTFYQTLQDIKYDIHAINDRIRKFYFRSVITGNYNYTFPTRGLIIGVLEKVIILQSAFKDCIKVSSHGDFRDDIRIIHELGIFEMFDKAVSNLFNLVAIEKTLNIK